MKKVLYLIISVLELALVIGTYIFNYFSTRKLGMTRFVNGMNMNWQKNYPVEMLKLVVVAVIVVTTILLLVSFARKREKMDLEIRLSTVAMTVLSFVYISFTLLSGVGKMSAYYFISLMLGLAALLQIIKVFIKLRNTPY